MRIGFQTHFLFFRVIASGLDLLRQKLQQGLRPLQTGSRGLQQFTQMQQIGQTALPERLRDQTLRYALAVHPLVKHGQHAVLLPELQPLLAGLGQRIAQLRLVHGLRQFVGVPAPDAAGHGAAQPTRIARHADGTQHTPQVCGLRALVHIGVVGQKHAGQTHARQGCLHGLRMRVRAHQHRHLSGVYVCMCLQ